MLNSTNVLSRILRLSLIQSVQYTENSYSMKHAEDSCSQELVQIVCRTVQDCMQERKAQWGSEMSLFFLLIYDQNSWYLLVLVVFKINSMLSSTMTYEQSFSVFLYGMSTIVIMFCKQVRI